MPKVNVYLPDDLADAVRDTGVPVSAICQRALEQAVRRITAIRQTVLDALDDHDLTSLLPAFTGRAAAVLALARDTAGPSVTTGDLLNGLVAEGGNLALQVLRSMEIDPRRLAVTDPAEPGSDGDGLRFSTAAANALELAVGEATGLGHNYVGCEHLVIGLAAEPDGAAGRALRAAGADSRALRRGVSAALAGYTHLRAQSAPAALAAATSPAPSATSASAPWAAASAASSAAASVTSASAPSAAMPSAVPSGATGQALAAMVRQELAPLVRRIEALEAHLR